MLHADTRGGGARWQGIMASVDNVVSYRACDRAIRHQRACNRTLPALKGVEYADIDEAVANTSAPAAIIDEK